jgi:hypothetical protein
MQTKATTIKEYIENLTPDRREAVEAIRKVIKQHLPKGFEECMSYGMIGYVVPHSLYPKGYHCDPKLPLPLINVASQKNAIVLHHLGIYGSKPLLDWFMAEYPKYVKSKLDMGKGCIRFKKPEEIPLKLIGELAAKISPKQWIELYEKNLSR